MFSHIETLDTTLQIYFYIGLFSSGLFIILNFLMFLGLLDELGLDIDIDLEIAESTFTPYKLITFRGIVAFFIFFGWVGFKSDNFFLALFVGLIAFLSVGSVYYFTRKLTDQGNFELENAIGREGTVYLKINSDFKSVGKVNIILSDSVQEMNAISEQELAYNDKIVVVDIKDDLLIVKKIEKEN